MQDFSMEVRGDFFNKLRTLAVTLEKQTEQLGKIFHNDGIDEFEEDSPIRYLHELYSDVRTLKGDADTMLSKRSSERDATYNFIKATKVLLKKNAGDVKEIEDLFQKYGYKPVIDKDTVAQDEAEMKPESNPEETKSLSEPAKSSWDHSPLQVPQLSDFGLSRYAVPSSSSIMHHVPKEEARVAGPDHPSPKGEHFHIHGHNLHINDETTSLPEDQTIFLLHNVKNIRQANKSEGAVELVSSTFATPKQKNSLSDFDYTASPAVPSFCTPGLKVPRRNATALPKSPEDHQSGGSKDGTEMPPSGTQSLKTESEVYINIAPNRDLVESTVEPIMHQKCLEVPLPPPLQSDYSSLLSSPPPPPAITVIPEQIFQILSKNIPKAETSRSLVKDSNENKVPQSSLLQMHDKENRKFWMN